MSDVSTTRRRVLERLVDRYGLAQVAKRMGKPASQINDMLAGRKSFGEKVARAMEKAWDPSRHDFWMDTDSGAEPPPLDQEMENTPTESDFALVPQLDIAAACGEGKFIDHVVVKGGLAFKRSSLREFGVSEKTARIIYASGGSMWPTMQDGCVVLIDTADREPREGKVYAVCTPDGGLVLKRLVRDYHPAIGSLVWIMRSDNPDKTTHPDKVLPPDDRTMIAGRAIWNDNRL
ncbi:S24 family peptidase [Ralstonia mannitolilytica]|uniref:S24 family peptidase n=1 Tax=Ralstonia mannitolilytica TaxID=105219 RepID=UPI00292DD7AB|nr:S24 family peptidase [Ralstonia mannitolilytica]